MLYCHILDDFCLQGILASLKQKSWWEENYPNKLYKYDYIISLSFNYNQYYYSF